MFWSTGNPTLARFSNDSRSSYATLLTLCRASFLISQNYLTYNAAYRTRNMASLRTRACSILLAFAAAAACSKQPGQQDLSEFEKAQALYQNRKLPEALEAADRFHQRFPEFGEAAVLSARIRFFMKDFSGAEIVLKDYLKHEPDHPYALMWLGRTVSAQEGRAAEASAVYRKVLAADPDNHFAHYYLGRSLEAEGKLKDAIAEYERSLAAEYQISKVHLHMARLFKELDMHDRADRHKNRVKALRVSQNDIEAVSSL